MVKVSMTSTKYVIYGDFEVEGYIDKPDLIGAFFGQTEGLIGDNLEFQNLQKTGKIGRIDINLNNYNSKSKGNFIIPTSLDKVEVSLVAAAIESITKIGHTVGYIKITQIKDKREEKRKVIIKRAEELLEKLKEELPDSDVIRDNITENISKKKIKKYGQNYFGGENIEKYDELILVEGRADVLNMLKNGFDNVLSFHGSNKLTKKFLELIKNKEITLFLDDDRAGKQEFKVLKEKIDPYYFAICENGKEVEELSYKEIIKCLKNKKVLKDNKDKHEENKIKYDDNYSAHEIKKIIFNKLKEEFEKQQENAKPKIQKLKKNIKEEFEDLKEKSKPKLKRLQEKIINKGKEVINNIQKEQENLKVVEDSNHFDKKQFDKIEYLIKKIENKSIFILLNNNFKQIKVGAILEFNKIELKTAKILIVDGVCEKSILKKSKEIGIELIICKSKSKNLKFDNIKVKLFLDFNKN